MEKIVQRELLQYLSKLPSQRHFMAGGASPYDTNITEKIVPAMGFIFDVAVISCTVQSLQFMIQKIMSIVLAHVHT